MSSSSTTSATAEVASLTQTNPIGLEKEHFACVEATIVPFDKGLVLETPVIFLVKSLIRSSCSVIRIFCSRQILFKSLISFL